MLRLAICDDEHLAVKNLQFLIGKYDEVEVVFADSSPLKLLKAFENGLVFDAVFLDISMPELNGLELAETISSIDSEIDIVFCTAYEQYAINAFDLNAIDYLLKPIDRIRLDKTITRLISNNHHTQATIKRAIPQIFCLGKFDIIVDGSITKWPSRKSEEVVAFLQQNYNNSVHKEQIIENLWPESDLSAALVNLQSTIYRARKTLAKLNKFVQITYHKDYYRLMFSGYSEFFELERICSLKPKKIEVELASKLERWYDGGSYLESNGWLWSYSHATLLEKKLSAYIGICPD